MRRILSAGRVIAISFVITGALLAPASAQGQPERLGNVSFPISCASSQQKFNRAVALLHNFFFPETVKAFQEILKDDPDCAMGYWGLAMSNRPNPLVPPFAPQNLKAGWEAIQRGKAAKQQSSREAAYLAALEVFFKDFETVDQQTRAGLYRDAMAKLSSDNPGDVEGAIFYALSLNEAVNLSDKTYTDQLKAAAILTTLSKSHPNHPGIAHYLIHSYDYAPLAELCVPTANLYDKIAVDAPHALHMPSHIYSTLGLWDDSIRANLAAERSGNSYAAKHYPDFTDPTVPHALDFIMYAYMQTARDAEARALVDRLKTLKPTTVQRLTIDTALLAIPARYVVDRGAWAEAAELEVRESQFPQALAITHFTRGLGAARVGEVAAARASLEELKRLEGVLDAAKDMYWSGQLRMQQIALSGWIAKAEGDHIKAVAEMHRAAELDDASEKHVAMENKLLPMRALLGELFLSLGEVGKALETFEASLKTVPNRYQSIAAAAEAARVLGNTEIAKRYARALVVLSINGNTARPEIVLAKQYIAAQ